MPNGNAEQIKIVRENFVGHIKALNKMDRNLLVEMLYVEIFEDSKMNDKEELAKAFLDNLNSCLMSLEMTTLVIEGKMLIKMCDKNIEYEEPEGLEE